MSKDNLDLSSISRTYQHVAMSFGAGVQSTAMLLLTLKEPERVLSVMGQLPDAVYFADPGAEGKQVYTHLEEMKKLCSSHKLPFYHIRKSLKEEIGKSDFSPLPLFTKGENGKVNMLRRTCTDTFKIRPVRAAIREVCGFAPRTRHNHAVGVWLGISTDEISRMTDSKAKWCDNLYPLIDLGMSRSDCYEYCRSYGITPSKSSCYFCPFTSDWHVMKALRPEDFALAVAMDEAIRDKYGLANPCYLHRSCKPLLEAVNIQEDFDYEGFDAECTGHCGV